MSRMYLLVRSVVLHPRGWNAKLDKNISLKICSEIKEITSAHKEPYYKFYKGHKSCKVCY